MRRSTSMLLSAAIALSVFPVTAFAEYDTYNDMTQITYNYDGGDHTRYMEKLDRGLVAVRTKDGVFLSWRLLGDEATIANITATPDFEIYKNGDLIATVDNSTNYLDKSGTESDTYSIKIIDGEMSNAVTPHQNNYFDIALSKPDPFIYTEGDNSYSYEYTVGDASCGDLDGDGQYEIIMKWDANPKDNSQAGITGNVLLDAYKFDGTRLWRIDLGRNIRSGAHYTQFLVYDFDGDGKAELACKTAPGSKDSAGEYVTKASHVLDIQNVQDEINKTSYVNGEGRILDGDEYYTVFGSDGRAIDTIYYPFPRGNVASWGNNENYGNRVDRFLGTVAYLDGVHPYMISLRGYYGKTTVAAMRLIDGQLSVKKTFTTDDNNGRYEGQGNHNMTVADIDDDGKDEIITGVICWDDDLSLKWCSGRGHGDALHIGDYDPTHQGLEYFTVFESGKYTISNSTTSTQGQTANYGMSVYDAATGEELFHEDASADTGRGVMANVGMGGYYQIWSSKNDNLYLSNGGSNFTAGSKNGLSQNFRVFWDADLYDELLDGTGVKNWNGNGMINIFNGSDYGCISINGTKANPVLQADLFGDWREELIYPTSDNNSLRVFTTTDITEYKLTTLMHDPVYRSGVAAEQTAYNQPPHIGFYLADEIYRPAVSSIEIKEYPDKTVYDVGDTFNADGLRVIARFTDDTEIDVTDHVVFTGFDSFSTGDQTITITYSDHKTEFEVRVDSRFEIDSYGYIVSSAGGNSTAIIPKTLNGMNIKGIRKGALQDSGINELIIFAETMDIEDEAIPENMTLKVSLGSDAYIYAVSHGISYEILDTGEYIFDIDYSENDYSNLSMFMGAASKDRSVGHMHYYVGGRPNGGGDGCTGFDTPDDNGDPTLRCQVGRFHTFGRNAYFTLEDMPLLANDSDTVFQTDIRFDSNDGRKANIEVFDTYTLGRNPARLTTPIDTISQAIVSGQHSVNVEEDAWYTYKLVCHNGKYYRIFAPKGEAGSCVMLGDCDSEFGAVRFDFTSDSDIDNNKYASITLDNTKAYTNTEIADMLITVTDHSGDPIQDASIVINGKSYTADINGELSLELPVGLHDVSVSAEGYYTSDLLVPIFNSFVDKAVELRPVLDKAEGISFAKDRLVLKEGNSALLEVIAKPENAELPVLKYISSNHDVAAVDETGKVTALKAGTTTITAISQENENIKAECILTVYGAYNSIVSSIEIDGPDTAYIPNNLTSNLVQLAARCYDQNGVEMAGSQDIKWSSDGDLSISSDGIVSVTNETESKTYTIYAMYNDIKSNEKQITLVSYPDNSDLIAKEDCTGPLNIKQSKAAQSVTIDDITYNVGARSGAGDNYSGFAIDSFNGEKCLFAQAGKWGSSGREAYMVFDQTKNLFGYDTNLDYVFETDLYFNDSNVNIAFEDNTGEKIMDLNPDISGLKTREWYHYMLIYSNGGYSQYVTDADGNNVKTMLSAINSEEAISQIRFSNGKINEGIVYFKHLKYYTADNAFSTIKVKTVDINGTALSGITVNMSGNTAVTNDNGVVRFVLPLGAYSVSASKDGDMASAAVMSTGFNTAYTLVLGENEKEPEKVTTCIDMVSGKTIYASTNGEGLRLYAAKYTNGVLSDISAFDAVKGTSYYNTGFEPDKVFLWNAMQNPIDIWTKKQEVIINEMQNMRR